MDTLRETFNKSERLCSVKVISNLFEDGKVFYNPLFKIVWAKSAVILPFPAQIAFSVSKRNFKLAVTRNLIKRRLREVWRRNKKTLYEQLASENIQVVLFVILRGSSVPDYVTIDKSIKEVIGKLIELSRKAEDASRKQE